jgi:hypothetical protein
MPSNNVSTLLAKMLSAFRAMPKSAIDDLHDQLDSTFPNTPGDLWNDGSRGLTPRVTTGPAESASGSGAEKRISDWSDGAAQTGVSAAYEAFARELADQGKRVESVEKAVSAIAGLISAAVKGDAAAMFNSDSEDDEKKEEDEDTKKGRVHVANVGNVPNLMKTLLGMSRSGGTLASPPSMAVIKSGDEWNNAIIDADNRGDHAAVLRLKTLRMRALAKANGADVSDRLLAGADFQNPVVSSRQAI